MCFRPYSACFIIDKKNRYYPTEQKELIRYIPQIPEDALFSNLSVLDNIKMLKLIFNIKKNILNEICTDLKINQNLALWHLSVGQKKMLLLKIMIYSLPEANNFGSLPIILLLDEPFAGLDGKNQIKVFDDIKKLSTTYKNNPFKIVIIDHLNITPMNNESESESELRDGIKLKIIPTNNISYQNAK